MQLEIEYSYSNTRNISQQVYNWKSMSTEKEIPNGEAGEGNNHLQ